MEPWIPVQLTVRTPMFLAADAGGPAELRPSALRGSARFWFRALAAPVFADDFTAVARAEAEVFGAAAKSGSRIGPSPVAFRIVDSPRPTSDTSPNWLRRFEQPGQGTDRRPGNGIGYLLGQAFYVPPSPKNDRPHPELSRPSHLAPEPPNNVGAFAVRVSAGRGGGQPTAEYLRGVVAACLWAASTFGGLGARTRRGFGGFTLDGLDGLAALPDLAGIAGADEPLSPAHPVVRAFQELVAARYERPVPLAAQPASLGTGHGPWPTAPTAGRWHIGVGRSAATWPQQLNDAGRMLRAVRAPVDRGTDPYPEGQFRGHKRWVTHEYVDAVVPALRGRPPADRHSPAASFGLPLNFGGDGTLNLRADGKELRRASPLWIRLHREPSGQYRKLLHVFESAIGPADADLILSAGHRTEAMNLDEDLAYRTIAEYVHQALSA